MITAGFGTVNPRCEPGTLRGSTKQAELARPRRRPIIGHVQASPRSASIIAPAYREAGNLEPLISRIAAAARLSGWTVEILIVDDDSQDGTEELIGRLGTSHPVRLIVRHEQRGLASAVLAGFREAKFDRFVVLDADLQHPPELIPDLLQRLDDPGCDFVLGTRYGHAGSIVASWPWKRRFASRLATLSARPLARVSDPMSGYFALPRSTWERADRLDPVGYKIALELIVKGRCRQVAEIPIRFDVRSAGESKFGIHQAIAYARHLGRLYRFRFPWLMPVVLVALAAFVLYAVFAVKR